MSAQAKRDSIWSTLSESRLLSLAEEPKPNGGYYIWLRLPRTIPVLPFAAFLKVLLVLLNYMHLGERIPIHDRRPAACQPSPDRRCARGRRRGTISASPSSIFPSIRELPRPGR